jgi:hypothetical protein
LSAVQIPALRLRLLAGKQDPGPAGEDVTDKVQTLPRLLMRGLPIIFTLLRSMQLDTAASTRRYEA